MVYFLKKVSLIENNQKSFAAHPSEQSQEILLARENWVTS